MICFGWDWYLYWKSEKPWDEKLPFLWFWLIEIWNCINAIDEGKKQVNKLFMYHVESGYDDVKMHILDWSRLCGQLSIVDAMVEKLTDCGCWLADW